MPDDGIRRGPFRWDPVAKRWIRESTGKFALDPKGLYITPAERQALESRVSDTSPNLKALPFSRGLRHRGVNLIAQLRAQQKNQQSVLEDTLFATTGREFADNWQTDRFDIFSWFEAGANTGDILQAANAQRLQLAIDKYGPQRVLKALERFPRFSEPAFENLFDFYGRQYFSYREEGKDVEEHFKSIIGQTSIGQFIEDALERRLEYSQGVLGKSNQAVINKLREIYDLRYERTQRFIASKDYRERTNKLYDELNELKRTKSLALSKYHEYRRTAYYPSGPHDITKFAPDVPSGLTDWNQLLKGRRLSRDQLDIIEYLHHHPFEDRTKFRQYLNLVGGRNVPNLGDVLLPLEREGQTLISQQRRITAAYNLISLQTAGAIGGPQSHFLAGKGLYGLEGKIQQLVDLNKWETTRTGLAKELPMPPKPVQGISAHLGALVTPENIVAENLLGTLGLKPLHTTGPFSSEILEVLTRYPANQHWFDVDQGDSAKAAEKVYGDISRQVRMMVRRSVDNLGMGSETESFTAKAKLYRSILGPGQNLSSSNIAEQLIAYAHAKPYVGDFNNDEYKRALHETLMAQDPFAAKVKQILSNAIPGIETLGPAYDRYGNISMPWGFENEYAKLADKAFRQNGIVPTGRALFARVSEAREHIFRPQAVNERLQSFSAASEISLGGKLPATSILGKRPEDLVGREEDATEYLSEEIEAAQTALKRHDVDLNIATFRQKLSELNKARRAGGLAPEEVDARRLTAQRLRQAQGNLSGLLDEIASHGKTTRTAELFSERVNEYLKAITPLRAAEYYRAGIPFRHFPLVGQPKTSGNIHSIDINPSFRTEVQRLVGVIGGDAELADNWRLNYALSHYSKSVPIMAAEHEETRLSMARSMSDFLEGLKLTDFKAASRRGIHLNEAYNHLANVIGTKYKMPVISERIREAMQGERSLSPFYASTLHEFHNKLSQYEGQHFEVLEPTTQRFFKQLGGEGPLRLTLENIEPVELAKGGELFAKNKRMYGIEGGETGRVAANFMLPEELSAQERIRSYAALRLPKIMEEWSQNPAMSQLVSEIKKGRLLSVDTTAAVMQRAEQMLNEARGSYHLIQSFKEEALTATEMPDNLGEENQILEQFKNLINRKTILERDRWTGKYVDKTVPASEMEATREAERLVRIYKSFGRRSDWGKIIVPTGNDEQLARLAPLDQHALRVGSKNLVTKTRAAKNNAIANYYLNWHHQLPFGEYRNLSITNPATFPMIEGEHVNRGVFEGTLKDIEEDLQKQNINLSMIEDITGVLGKRGNIWLEAPNVVERASIAGVESAKTIIGGSNIVSPLAFGNLIDVGAETKMTLGQVYGRYLWGKSASKSELLELAKQVGIKFEGPTTKLRKDSIFARFNAGNIDIGPETARAQIVNDITQRVRAIETLASDEQAGKVLTDEQRTAIKDIFERYRDPEGRIKALPKRSTADIGAEAEEALKRFTNQKQGYARIRAEEMKRLWGNKTVRRGTITLGAFALWGMIRSHQQSHQRTLAQMQGPRNLPGGNTPYTQGSPPSTLTALPAGVYATPNIGSQGYTYRIRATGNINPDQFQTQAMTITGAPISSGSIYNSRALSNPDQNMNDLINQYS